MGEWRDLTGRAFAFGYRGVYSCLLQMENVGDYRLDQSSGQVMAYPGDPPRPILVADTYYRSILPLFLQAQGIQGLHASAVVWNDRVYGFCANSGVGKSTLAWALAGLGMAVWTDDALVHVPTTNGFATLGLPFHLRLKDQPLHWLGDMSGSVKPGGNQAEILDVDAAQRLPLAGLFFLSRDDALPGKEWALVEHLHASVAINHLLAQAYVFDLDRHDQRRELVSHYLTLAQLVPTYGLTIRSDRRSLDHLAAAVASIVESH